MEIIFATWLLLSGEAEPRWYRHDSLEACRAEIARTKRWARVRRLQRTNLTVQGRVVMKAAGECHVEAWLCPPKAEDTPCS